MNLMLSWIAPVCAPSRFILFFSVVCCLIAQQPAWSQDVDARVFAGITENIIAEYGYLDAAAYFSAVQDYESNRQWPDTDGESIGMGICSGTQPSCAPDDAGDLNFPGVRNIRITAKDTDASQSLPSFKVKWRKPLALPEGSPYELSHYEVYLVQDRMDFEHYAVMPKLRADGSIKLKRKIRFRHKNPGDYEVYVRAMYQLRTAQASQYRLSFADKSGNTRNGYGGILGSGWGGGSTKVTDGDQLSVLNTYNRALYDCLSPTHADSTLLGNIHAVICPDAGISNLDGLEGFSGLQTLDLHNTVASSNPNLFTDLKPLITSSSSDPVSPTLSTMNFAGVVDLSATLDQQLYKFDALRHLNLSRAGLNSLPSFQDSTGTERMVLQTLDLRDNNLTAITGIDQLLAVNHLWLDNNPLSNTVLSSVSPLANFSEMVALSLVNTQLSGSGLTDAGLPADLGMLYLDGNPALTRYQRQAGSAKKISYILSMTGDTAASCQSIQDLSDWFYAQPDLGHCVGDPAVGEECYRIQSTVYWPTYCEAEPPQQFSVEAQSDLQGYIARWLPPPAAWGVNLYKIHYRVSNNPFQTYSVSVNGGDLSVHGMSLDALGSGYYQFAIQACYSDTECGAPTAYIDADYPLLPPLNTSVNDNTNNVATIQWAYPSLPAGASQPDHFKVSSMFGVVADVTEAFSNGVNNIWTLAVNGIDQYPAGVLRVSACQGTGTDEVCGDMAEVTALSGPQGVIALSPPAAVNLTVPPNAVAGEFNLSWGASPSSDVDYYLVEELTSNATVNRQYAIEETTMAVKRYDHSEGAISFAVKACRRDRDNGDECSASASISNSGDVNTVYNITMPTNVCWYGEALLTGGYGSVKLKWEYPLDTHDAPRFFDIQRADDYVNIIPNASSNSSWSFGAAEYNADAWYWEQELIVFAGNLGMDVATSFRVSSRFGATVVENTNTITPLQLDENGQQFWDLNTQCTDIPPPPDNTQGDPTGGPGDLQPGHWSDDPAHKGSGWRFYWANDLRFDEMHQAFGISYDLIGFWTTYKLIDGQWSPVWYFARMQLVDDGTNNGTYFEGALVYPRQGADDQQVGTVRLWFESDLIDPAHQNDNQYAWIEVQVNQGDGLTETLSHQVNDIALNHPAIGQDKPANQHDHYSGVWTTGDLFTAGDVLANHDFFMVEWIEKDLLSTAVNFFDTLGRPIWIVANRCAQGNCGNVPDVYGGWQTFDHSQTAAVEYFWSVYPGNNPMAEVPLSWGEVNEHHAIVTGHGGRGHSETSGPQDYLTSQVCFGLSVNMDGRAAQLNQGTGCSNATPTSTVTVNKVANLHHIGYNVAGDDTITTCHLDETNPNCEIRLTWFTDDDYPFNAPYFTRDGGAEQPLSALCPNGVSGNGPSIDETYVVAEYVCHITEAGHYSFLLKNRDNDTALRETIARSNGLNITGVSPNSPGVAPVPDTPITAATAHTLDTSLPDHDATIGAVAGEAGVSGGAATYQIPINVPPGRQGMRPNINLGYSSRAGNGVLGMGWSLSVGSSIHRCPQTLAQDGQTIGVRFQNTDRLCLDGQRLMRVNAGGYWAGGGIYRTEIDSFNQVKLIGAPDAANGSSIRFEVRGKDNLIRHYGVTTNSKVKPKSAVAGTVVSAWLLSQETDQYGNRVDYLYTAESHGAGEHLLDRIHYTGNSASMGDRTVEFDYDGRCINGVCDEAESWQRGYQTRQTQRLDTIRTCLDSACTDQVREYALNYHLSDVSGRLLLESIQECAIQGISTQCLPATHFGWGDQQPDFDYGEWTINDGTASPPKVVDGDPMVFSVGSIGARIEPAGDFDGDGTREFQISDGISRDLVSLDAEGHERWRVNSTAAAAMFGPQNNSFVTNFANPVEIATETAARIAELDPQSFATEGERTTAEQQTAAAVEAEFVLKALPVTAFSDLDNDGRVDLYGAIDADTNGTYELAFSRWIGIGQTSNSLDDHFDLVLTDLPVTVTTTATGDQYVIETPIWGDINGDGLTDALLYKSVQQTHCADPNITEEVGAIELWVNKGLIGDRDTGYYDFDQHPTNNGIIYTWPCTTFNGIAVRETASRPSLEDFNGDGVLDIAIPSQINDILFPEYSIANVIINDVVIPTGYQSAVLRYLLADVDSTGVAFDEKTLWTPTGENLGMHSDPRLTYHLPMDINGDGLTDYLFMANNQETTLTIGQWYVQIHQGDGLSAPIPLNVPTANGLDIALQALARTLDPNLTVGPLTAPQYALLIKAVDWNSDGRTDLLVPRRLRDAICVQILHRIIDLPPGSQNPDQQIRGTYCPGNMDGTLPELGAVNDIGEPSVPVPESTVGGIYFNGFGANDPSTYEMGVVEFVYNAASNSYSLQLIEAGVGGRIIANNDSRIADFNGDGIIDIVTPFGCQESDANLESTTNPETSTKCTTNEGIIADIGVNYPLLPYSHDFHCNYFGAVDNGADCGANHVNSKRGYYLTQVRQQRQDVLDLMLSAVDGLDNFAFWRYAPLSSSPERMETDLPLYLVPNRELGIDYLQNGKDDHFYFTSSMYVVSSFDQSNALWETDICSVYWQDLLDCTLNDAIIVPLFNTTYFGYEEAIYNNRGRGFQGFRKVVSEQIVTQPTALDDDSDNNVRSVSVFHQIFPLAGRIEATYTQPASMAYSWDQDRHTSGVNTGAFQWPNTATLISISTFDYACRTGALNYVGGCAIGGDIGTAQAEITGASAHGVYHPLTRIGTTNSFEPDVDELPTTTYRYAVNQTQSDYDAYGNVITQTSTASHYSPTDVLLTQTQSVSSNFTIDESNWWLNRLDRTITTSTSDYPNVPNTGIAGFENIGANKTITQLLAYNTQRRPNCQYTVEGNQNPNMVECSHNHAMTDFGTLQATRTVTAYDAFGNPADVYVDAADLASQRHTSSAYPGQAYFPGSVTNALGHTVATVIDAREGNPTQITDANNRITQMTYDAFGREIQRWSPNTSTDGFDDLDQHYAPRSKTIYQRGAACGSDASIPEAMTYCTWSVSDGAPVVWQALDSVNRVLQTRTNGFKPSSVQDRSFVEVTYNARGQVVFETVPHFNSLSLDGAESRYDVLGRVIYKSQPATTGGLRYSHYQHNGLSTTVHVSNASTAPASCTPASPTAALGNDLCVQRTYAANGWLLSTVDAHGSATRFWNDGQGNAKLIEDATGNLIAANYNHFGQRTELFDPNMGHWTFSYNGLGEVVLQTDAKGQQVVYSYDKLGRTQSRIVQNSSDGDLGGIEDRWIYDPVGGDGLLDREQRNIGLAAGATATVFDKSYSYDQYQRPTGYTVDLDPYYYPSTGAVDTPVLDLSASYTVSMAFDGYFGRVKSITYPQERLRLYQQYDVNGYLKEEGNSLGDKYREVLAMNAAGQVTAESLGQLFQQYNYHDASFQMQHTHLNAGLLAPDLMALDYQYDLYGNLSRQDNSAAGEWESFSYDHLHRLTSSSRSNGGMISYHYDAVGNITQKSDYAVDYQYQSTASYTCPAAMPTSDASPGPNAARKADGYRYGYDDNGNMMCGSPETGNLAVHYDPYNQPFRTQRNGNTAEFWYGPNDQRYFQLADGQRTVYLDKLYEQKGSTVHKQYLGDFAVYTIDITNSNNTGITYLHKDRLGSVVAMSDDQGQLISGAGRGFDPFGKPREGDWANSNNNDNAGQPGDLNRPDITPRGFTGHEQLNNVALTHMNGRAYDYNLGRFLSVDPFIAFPGDSQSLNPYSYVLNNPMAGTDPTGYLPSVCGLGEISRCDGGVAFLKEQNNRNKAYKLDVNLSNGGKGSITFRLNDEGGLDLFTAEIEDIGGLSLRNSIACTSACATPAATRTVLGVFAAAGIAAVSDSPFPGPGDAVAIGILVYGLTSIALEAVDPVEVGLPNVPGDDIGGPNNTVSEIQDIRGPDAVFNESDSQKEQGLIADAPGKPTEEDGFNEPKRQPNTKDSKVKNPNGSGKGWLDAEGNVWVPTGPGGSLPGTTGSAHGGSHWDVQNPKTGQHVNVYPGGRKR